SMPEFFVSFVSAIKGTPDLAIGNVVGSNIFNALLIVGVSAAVTPIAILKGTVRKDIPFACFASLLLLVLCFDGSISRIDAAILFATFLGFLLFTLKNAKSGDEDENEPLANTSVLKSVVFIIGGLAGLISGSNLFVDSATFVAQQLGVSEAVIGLTIVAGGTSLPELATSVVAAKKGNSGIAIGNVLGSNVFNILAILGLTGVISPMKINGITMLDFALLIVSMLLLWVFSYTKYTIKRWEGFVLIGVFLAYMSYLFMHI
ncbi:MAG: calcium/sodium antiporter, partial [Prevotella nanceiensis]|nr:calcium/sodium antiporter [Hoylesella nanceiensis]